MPTIFVSYRRKDTAYETTAIAGKLASHFGRDHVFMDVDTIPAGQDFREVIRHSLGQCDVAIIVIGERWLELDANSEERRIDNSADYVRLEIETVLSKSIPVIPLLVGGAQMPTPAELPDSIADLAYRHAMLVRPGRDFDRDIDSLIADISRSSDFQKNVSQNSDVSVPTPERVSQKPDSTEPAMVTSAPVQKTRASAQKTRRAATSQPVPNRKRTFSEFSQASWFLVLYFGASIFLLLFAYVCFAATFVL